MKRKRGRPKGSTKKPSAEEELAEKLVCPSEDSLLALADGSGLAPGSLECAKCCRKFSNARQLRKHVCIIVLNLGEDDAEAGTCRAGAARRAPRGEPAMCTGARHHREAALSRQVSPLWGGAAFRSDRGPLL